MSADCSQQKILRRFIEGFTPGMKASDPTPFPTPEQALASLRDLEEQLQTALTERDAIGAALSESCAECGHVDWRSHGYLDAIIDRALATERTWRHEIEDRTAREVDGLKEQLETAKRERDERWPDGWVQDRANELVEQQFQIKELKEQLEALREAVAEHLSSPGALAADKKHANLRDALAAISNPASSPKEDA